MTTTENYRVSLTEKLTYAAPAFALAVVGIPVYVYIPKFYTDVVGINITVLVKIIRKIFKKIRDITLKSVSPKRPPNWVFQKLKCDTGMFTRSYL
jgi:Na+/melibiose symporter-like transporter